MHDVVDLARRVLVGAHLGHRVLIESCKREAFSCITEYRRTMFKQELLRFTQRHVEVAQLALVSRSFVAQNLLRFLQLELHEQTHSVLALELATLALRMRAQSVFLLADAAQVLAQQVEIARARRVFDG